MNFVIDWPSAGLQHMPFVKSLLPKRLAYFFPESTKNSLRRFFRRKNVSPAGWPELRRLTPISNNYGIDRGEPMDRYYIGLFMDQWKEDIKGRVLEIQSSGYTERYGRGKVIHKDILDIDPQNKKATLIGDLQSLDQVSSNLFDCVIITQTLQYLYDVRAGIRHIARILKPGGVVLATLPSVSQLDPGAAEMDCWRFTAVSARRLFREYFPEDAVQLQSYGNVLTCTAFLMGLASHELKTNELDYHDPNLPLVVCVRAVKANNH